MVILNEKEYAEKCLLEGIVDKKPYFTLFILAKYYNKLGYDKNDIRKLLTEHLEKYYSPFRANKFTWGETIDEIVERSEKYKLYEFSGVNITKSEFEKINSLPRKPLRIVAFTLLCLAKFGNLKNEKNNGWVNFTTKEVFTFARVVCSTTERDYIYGDLGLAGLIEFPKKNDNLSVRVTFIDDESEIALIVSDFRELGYEYKKYIGENYIRCRDCGILVRGNKTGTKCYCDKCKSYTPQETKTITCVDCGIEVTISAFDRKSNRCEACRLRHKKEYDLSFMKNKREKLKAVGTK